MVANVNQNVKTYLYLWTILDQLSYEFGKILDSGVLALQHFKFFGGFLSRSYIIFNSLMVLLTLIRCALAASVGIFFIELCVFKFSVGLVNVIIDVDNNSSASLLCTESRASGSFFVNNPEEYFFFFCF